MQAYASSVVDTAQWPEKHIVHSCKDFTDVPLNVGHVHFQRNGVQPEPHRKRVTQNRNRHIRLSQSHVYVLRSMHVEKKTWIRGVSNDMTRPLRNTVSQKIAQAQKSTGRVSLQRNVADRKAAAIRIELPRNIIWFISKSSLLWVAGEQGFITVRITGVISQTGWYPVQVKTIQHGCFANNKSKKLPHVQKITWCGTWNILVRATVTCKNDFTKR